MIDHLSFFQQLSSKWKRMRGKKMHKMKWRWQNQFWVTVASIFRSNASHLTPNYFMVIYKRSWADYFEIVLMSSSHPSGSRIREHKTLEKDSILHAACIFISGILTCLLAPTVLENWIFYSTCLKVSQKQVFFNDQPLFKCLTKIRKSKGGGDFQSYHLQPSTLKGVTPDKYLSNLFLRKLYEGKGFLNSP